jgi:hypothetical protein
MAEEQQENSTGAVTGGGPDVPSSPEEAPGPKEAFGEEMRLTEEREDRRWNATNKFNDWLLLIAIGIFQATWMIIVILLEPGIR